MRPVDLRTLTVAELIRRLASYDPEAWRIVRELVTNAAMLARRQRSTNKNWKNP